MKVTSQIQIPFSYVTAPTSPSTPGQVSLWTSGDYTGPKFTPDDAFNLDRTLYYSAPTSPPSGLVQSGASGDRTSPKPAPNCAFGPNRELYYSAPASPTKRIGNTIFSGHECFPFSDDFEFETSKKFDDGDEQERHFQQHERGGSLPTMAFADELFCNGQVLPLKLPPRLQSGQGSTATSPKRPPFSRRIGWKNEADPFRVALQKVTEEKRGRRKEESHEKNVHRRRTRSHSPFRPITLQNCGPKNVKPMEPKGITYARWVRDHAKQVETSPRGSRVKDSFMVHEPLIRRKIPAHEIKSDYHDVGGVRMETKARKLKGFLLKYASFGRKNNDDTKLNLNFAFWKKAYFTRLSFKFKGRANVNGKGEKMEVVKYKPALCIDYGIKSPRS